VRFDPLAIPFTVGWMPTGWYPHGVLDNEPGYAVRRYEGPRAEDELAVQVWNTRTSGRSATEPPAAGRTVRRHLGGDLWLAVGGTTDVTVLNRVLESVDLKHGERITFPFRLTWMPAGYQATASGSGTHHWYGDAAGRTLRADPPLLGAGLSLDTERAPSNGGALSIGVTTEDGSFQSKGLQPTGTLLGRPSRYTESDGLAVLHVYGLRGMHVQISAVTTGHPELTRATVERLVRGMRLVDQPLQLAHWTSQPLN
jgi:hypothetical protein